jgi:hypothetical protein
MSKLFGQVGPSTPFTITTAYDLIGFTGSGQVGRAYRILIRELENILKDTVNFFR